MPLPYIPVLNTAEIVFNLNVGGKDMKTILHAQHVGVILPADLADLAAAIIDVVGGSVGSLFSAATQLLSLTLNDLTTSTGLTLTTITGTTSTLPHTWSGGGVPLPNNCAFVTTMRTVARGRSFRGRNYWPGLTSTMLLNENTIQAVNLNNVVIFVAALNAAIISASGWTPVVVSKFTAGAPRSAGVVTEIASVTGFQKVGTQRRRLD